MKKWLRNSLIGGTLLLSGASAFSQKQNPEYLMKKLRITNKNDLYSVGDGYYTCRTGRDMLKECIGIYNGTIKINGNKNKYFLYGKMGNLEDNPELTQVFLEVGDYLERDKIITWQEALNLRNTLVERELRKQIKK